MGCTGPKYVIFCSLCCQSAREKRKRCVRLMTSVMVVVFFG